MRLAGQIKGGYYPLSPDAIRRIAQGLVVPPDTSAVRILDPCAGEGEAVWTLREALGVPVANTYAVELNEERGRKCRERGLKHVLAPCSAFGAVLGSQAYSLLYLNPPFDTQIGGGRVEIEWLKKMTNRLATGGILVMIVPGQVARNVDLLQMTYCNYNRVSLYPLPREMAPFDEWVITGERRSAPRPFSNGLFADERRSLGETALYHVGPCRGPERFEKTALTDDELLAAVRSSPLRKLLEPPPPRGKPSPPMPLGIGHLAILLAAGHLDGVVRPPGEEPHVVRGSAAKESHITEVHEEAHSDGSTTEKITSTERIKLVVRTVNARGELATLSSDG